MPKNFPGTYSFLVLLLGLFTGCTEGPTDIASGTNQGSGTETTNGMVQGPPGSPPINGWILLVHREEWASRVTAGQSTVIDSVQIKKGVFYFDSILN